MTSFIEKNPRTHCCGSLGAEQVDEQVVLMGWVHNRRDHGGCVFIDLRDRDGWTQVVFDPTIDAQTHEKASQLRGEWVIGVRGSVRSRGQNVNTKIKTGAIEVAVLELEIFSEAQTPPFEIEDNIDTNEEVRLKYRYLDLRRPQLQFNLIMRHRFNQIARQCLDAEGFLELETPFLIKSTPEGARDYVVPSRVQQGDFFALPQSPQMFKQLFMMGGFDRYFQIVRCFRDEDLRAERQPEFTQIDVELSFCTPEQVQQIIERMLTRMWQELKGMALQTPFERITYDESMRRFGVDAPDMRFGLELQDLTGVLGHTEFKVFRDALQAGGVVKGINVRDVGELSRKQLDELVDFVKIYGAKGMAWVKIKEDGQWQSPITKFLSVEEQQAIVNELDLQPGDTAVFVADSADIVHAALGNLRKHLAERYNLVSSNDFKFCWVTEFPLFQRDSQTQRVTAAHHPFTAPYPEDRDKMQSDPMAVRAQAYDIVLNGIEIGGGSIRIHQADVQRDMFAALGFSEQEAHQKFGFFLQALQYGVPPHGGIALGADRMMMLLCGTSSIRDVIAFPKTQKQSDLMLQAPDKLSLEQMLELGIRTTTVED